jgi:hypothetical protein
VRAEKRADTGYPRKVNRAGPVRYRGKPREIPQQASRDTGAGPVRYRGKQRAGLGSVGEPYQWTIDCTIF